MPGSTMIKLKIDVVRNKRGSKLDGKNIHSTTGWPNVTLVP